jgi:transcriptional regulator with XRE-family HTH domain
MRVVAKDIFREIRIKKGFTIVSLAAAVGTTKQTIGQIERGINGVGPENAKKIAEVLEVEFDEVFDLVKREG